MPGDNTTVSCHYAATAWRCVLNYVCRSPQRHSCKNSFNNTCQQHAHNNPSPLRHWWVNTAQQGAYLKLQSSCSSRAALALAVLTSTAASAAVDCVSARAAFSVVLSASACSACLVTVSSSRLRRSSSTCWYRGGSGNHVVALEQSQMSLAGHAIDCAHCASSRSCALDLCRDCNSCLQAEQRLLKQCTREGCEEALPSKLLWCCAPVLHLPVACYAPRAQTAGTPEKRSAAAPHQRDALQQHTQSVRLKERCVMTQVQTNIGCQHECICGCWWQRC